MFKKALWIALIMTLVACTGCTIGTKTVKKTLWINPWPIPEAAKGAPVIAEDREIELMTLGKPEFGPYRRKVTGYVVVDQQTWQKLVDVYNGKKDK